MKIVKVKATHYGIGTPAATVSIDDEGAVTWRDKVIGYVWKGSRRYSPPISRGSRIARYHREVPEWHCGERIHWKPAFRADTRQRAIQYLIAQVLEKEKTA